MSRKPHRIHWIDTLADDGEPGKARTRCGLVGRYVEGRAFLSTGGTPFEAVRRVQEATCLSCTR
jgi:hypothetical protein